MSSYIVTVSPKGQITLPAKERAKAQYKKYLLEAKGNVLVLQPVEVKVIASEHNDDMEGFSSLAVSSFDFWNNPEDDIYQKFYAKQKKQ